MKNELMIAQYARDLSKNKKVIELVKIMHPIDVAKVIQKSFDIRPQEAIQVFAHFVKELVEWTGTGRQLSSSKSKRNTC